MSTWKLSLSLSLIPLTPLVPPARAAAQNLCADGTWEAPEDHDLSGFRHPPTNHHFNAAHMALIPKGLARGRVLVWDYETDQSGPTWIQRWSIVDPTVPGTLGFRNFELELPDLGGDFFCAGLAWTPQGDLLVAGGTRRYQSGSHHLGGGQSWLGGKLVYLYQPALGPFGAWTRQPDLQFDRWYPTVTPLGNGQMLVLGGTPDSAGHEHNSYEAFDPFTNTWQPNGATQVFPGPQDPSGDLGTYPRIQLLSTGDVFLSGMSGHSARMNHVLAPGVWTPTGSMSTAFRGYNSSFLAPNRYGRDIVVTVGGEGFAGGSALGRMELVESCWAAAPGPPDWDWHAAGALKVGRSSANAVLLPDASVLVIGGEIDPQGGARESFTRTTELYDPELGLWRLVAERASYADYHSTAVLLPDGRVLSGGGEHRSCDYQVYVPPYLACGGARPVITGAPAVLAFRSLDPSPHRIHHAPMPPGRRVDRAVLMRASSTTHHSDFEQRCVELPRRAPCTPTSLDVFAPADGNAAPPGYYMLFLVSDEGVPSVASWVKLE